MAVACSPRRPPPSVKSRFPSSGLKKPFLPPFLEGVVDNLTLALTFACSRIWSPPMSVELAPWRHGRGRVKRSLPQQRGDCYAGAQLSGKPLGTVGERAVCTPVRTVSGLRPHRPGFFVGRRREERGSPWPWKWGLAYPAWSPPPWRALADCFPRCDPRRPRHRLTGNMRMILARASPRCRVSKEGRREFAS